MRNHFYLENIRVGIDQHRHSNPPGGRADEPTAGSDLPETNFGGQGFVEKLILHGGAGSMEGGIARHQKIRDALVNTLEESFRALRDAGAREAVLPAVRMLEDHELFNAGTGSMLQADGEIGIFRKGPGDGTVLRSSALMDERLSGAWPPTLVSPIKWDQVLFLFTEHLKMTRDPAFTDNLLFLLLENPRGG